MTTDLAFGIDRANRSWIDKEKREALSQTQGLSLVISTMLAISAATILYLDHSDGRLLAWLAAVVSVNLTKWCLLCLRPVQDRFRILPERWLMLSSGGSLASGLIWCVAPALLMDFRGVEAPFVCIILCGLTAGAALQSGASSLPVVLLSAPITVALIVKFALLGTLSGYVLSFDVLLYLCMVVRSCRGAETTFTKLAVLRWRSDALAADLQAQNQEAKTSAERFFRLANHDPLTCIANRTAFATELETRLGNSRASGGSLSLLLLDLDHFKAINDTLGHGAGDEVLKAVARRLEDHCAKGCFVARLGGDEFAVLASRGFDEEVGGVFADELMERVSAPLSVRDDPVHVGCSLGIARFPLDAATAEELLARADLALYAAKGAGRHAWRRFEPVMLSEAEIARDIERDLPAALASGAVEAWFQPQVEILSGRLVGLEALLRWRHPQLGWVRPPDVVAAALKLRKSELLTRHMLEQTCLTIKKLDDAKLDSVRIGVNISPREMGGYDLLALVGDVLASYAVEPSRLELEITEEAVVADDGAIETLAALRAMGVRLAIDDFGTGNSSIAYLRRLRMDRIKIDRSFVVDLVTNEGDRNLLQAIVSMGRSLGVEVIAEGVETTEEALVLRSLGCHLAQGFLYGKALKSDELNSRIAEELPTEQKRAPTPSGHIRGARGHTGR